MATVKAFAINTIKMGGTSHPASTREQVTIIPDMSEDDFERLEGLGAVRKPTKDELTLWEASDAAKNGRKLSKKQQEALDAADEGAGEGSGEGSGETPSTTPPASGAPGDPRGKPKNATTGKSADDLGV